MSVAANFISLGYFPFCSDDVGVAPTPDSRFGGLPLDYVDLPDVAAAMRLYYNLENVALTPSGGVPNPTAIGSIQVIGCTLYSTQALVQNTTTFSFPAWFNGYDPIAPGPSGSIIVSWDSRSPIVMNYGDPTPGPDGTGYFSQAYLDTDTRDFVIAELNTQLAAAIATANSTNTYLSNFNISDTGGSAITVSSSGGQPQIRTMQPFSDFISTPGAYSGSVYGPGYVAGVCNFSGGCTSGYISVDGAVTPAGTLDGGPFSMSIPDDGLPHAILAEGTPCAGFVEWMMPYTVDGAPSTYDAGNTTVVDNIDVVPISPATQTATVAPVKRLCGVPDGTTSNMILLGISRLYDYDSLPLFPIISSLGQFSLYLACISGTWRLYYGINFALSDSGGLAIAVIQNPAAVGSMAGYTLVNTDSINIFGNTLTYKAYTLDGAGVVGTVILDAATTEWTY